MKLIIGLGNPETQYDNTRHNTGFAVLDAFASRYNVAFAAKPKFHAAIAEVSKDGEKVLLVKPQTYYNLSGESVQSIVSFYKCAPSDVLVIHDELMLPLGTIRTRQTGSDAGNNGIKSITAHIGPDYARLRIGIQTDQRQITDDKDFVLSRFTREETERLEALMPRIQAMIDAFIDGNFEATTHSHTGDI